MPAPVYKGTFPVVKQQSWEKSKDGKFTYSITNAYKANDGVVTGVLGSTLSTLGKTFYLTNIDLVTKDAITEVTLEYVAPIADAGATQQEIEALTIYEASSVLSEEPISSHPAFTVATGIFTSSIVSAAGGAYTQGSGEEILGYGAIFSEEGVFVGFNKEAPNNFFGVQSYLTPKVTFRKTFSQSSAPAVSYTQKVGFIYDTPDAQAPSLTGSQNWLFTNLSWRNSGAGGTGLFEITEEYTGSGLNGWNDVIYKDSGS